MMSRAMFRRIPLSRLTPKSSTCLMSLTVDAIAMSFRLTFSLHSSANFQKQYRSCRANRTSQMQLHSITIHLHVIVGVIKSDQTAGSKDCVVDPSFVLSVIHTEPCSNLHSRPHQRSMVLMFASSSVEPDLSYVILCDGKLL